MSRVGLLVVVGGRVGAGDSSSGSGSSSAMPSIMASMSKSSSSAPVVVSGTVVGVLIEANVLGGGATGRGAVFTVRGFH